MPKRFLSKISPSRHKVEGQYKAEWIRRYLTEPALWKINHRTASKGVAIGVFCAWIPLPIQMVIAALIAIRIRGNLPLALTFTWITNPISFPFVVVWCAILGSWILPGYEVPTDFSTDVVETMGTLGELWIPTTFAWILHAIVTVPTSYYIIRGLWKRSVMKRYKSRHQRRATAGADANKP